MSNEKWNIVPNAISTNGGNTTPITDSVPGGDDGTNDPSGGGGGGGGAGGGSGTGGSGPTQQGPFWYPWQIISEYISSYDTYGVGGLGTIIDPADTTRNGKKWQIKFNCVFEMDEKNHTGYPIGSVIIELYKVLKGSDGNLIKITDTDGVVWDSAIYPSLKEKGVDLNSNHPLYGKLNKGEGTFEKVCAWDILVDNPYNLPEYYTQLYTFDSTKTAPITRNLTFEVSHDLKIKETSARENYGNGDTSLSVDETYFLKVLQQPENPNLRTRYYSFNSYDSIQNFIRINNQNNTGILLRTYFRSDGVILLDDPIRDYSTGQPKFPYIIPTTKINITQNVHTIIPNDPPEESNFTVSSGTTLKYQDKIKLSKSGNFTNSFYKGDYISVSINGGTKKSGNIYEISYDNSTSTTTIYLDIILKGATGTAILKSENSISNQNKEIWYYSFDNSKVSGIIKMIDSQLIFYFSQLAWFRTPKKLLVNSQYELVKNKINDWVNPEVGNGGSWYQLYDSWVSGSNGVCLRDPILNNGVNPPNPTGYSKDGWGGYFDKNLEFYTTTINNQINNEKISYPIHYYFNNIFEKEYNYQFIVKLPNFIRETELKLTTPWQDKIELSTSLRNNNKVINYNIFSNINSFSKLSDIIKQPKLHSKNLTNEYKISLPEKPINRVVSSTNPQNPITFTANTTFNNGMGIERVIIYKTKWFFQGYAAYSSYDTNTNKYIDDSKPNSTGWHYNAKESIFTYFNTEAGSTYSVDFPFGGDVSDYFSKKTQHKKYINDNFISQYITVQNFNLNFDYTNNSGMSIDIYTGVELPNNNNLNTLISDGLVKKVWTISKSKTTPNSSDGTKQNCEFIGLDGNQYIFIIVSGISTTNTFHEKLVIENLKTEGEYHKLNNTLFKNLDTTYKDNQNNLQTSYSIKLGSGNNVDANAVNDIYIINSKIGNSNFVSGIWETGVWQSGWRESNQYSFIDIDLFYSYDSDRRWRFIISGNKSTDDFNIGDKISISNVAVIDINGDRRLIKNYFTVSEKTNTTLVVEFYYDFPIRSIEKDSKNHLMMVTKSIWLNGIFLNGRFKGNWIDGIFKGFPFITKMEQSHWVDGIFDGGQFKSEIIKYNVSVILKDDPIYIIFETLEDNSFEIGDIFYLCNSKNSKISEIEFKVLSIIDSKRFYSDIRKDDVIVKEFNNVKILRTTKNNGLIQNIEFNSNNSSDKTISKSFISEYVFSYNSWLDLVYDESSASNIFKPQNIPNNTGSFFSENNLYGYITNDVLSSVSKFRDSFSNTIREYKLGTKWKIFYDYIGESSSFDDYFHSIYTPKKTSEMGWSLSVSDNPLPGDVGAINRFIGYRTDDKNEDITGKELKLVAQGDGGILNLDNKSSNNIPYRYTEKIKPQGYSIVSFDLINQSDFKSNDLTIYQKGLSTDTERKTWYKLGLTHSIVDYTSKYEPIFSFSNINQTNLVKNGKTYNKAMTYLPVYENINHLITKNKTKIEYFFNKRDLMLSLKGTGLYGSGTASVVIDNLKFYEIDMIPFFQYFKLNNINKGVQIPNGIDYVRFNYNIPNDYNYVSYTNIKTFNYFNIDKFNNKNDYNSKYWISEGKLDSLNIGDYFNKNI